MGVIRSVVMAAGLLMIAAIFVAFLASQVGGVVAGLLALGLILLARPWRAGRRSSRH